MITFSVPIRKILKAVVAAPLSQEVHQSGTTCCALLRLTAHKGRRREADVSFSQHSVNLIRNAESGRDETLPTYSQQGTELSLDLFTSDTLLQGLRRRWYSQR